MRKLALAAAIMLAASSAFAANLTLKAPPAPPVQVFPYDTAGLYYGITTFMSAATYNVSTPALGNQALTANGGSIGGVLGYSFPINRGANFAAFECSGAVQNVGGQQIGLINIKGPWSVACFAKFGGGLEQFFTTFSSVLPSFQLPTLPLLPAGLTSTKHHLYGALGGRVDDISAQIPGAASNSEWSGAFAARIGTIWQLTSNAAADTWIEYDGKGKSFSLGNGAPMFTPLITGADHKVMAGINFDL